MKTAVRPYQLKIIERVQRSLASRRSPLIVLPTGGGKTMIYVKLIEQQLRANKPCIVFVHREYLIRQTIALIQTELGISPQVSSARSFAQELRGFSIDGRVAVISLSYCERAIGKRALDRFSGQKGLAIFDEAHHIACMTWNNVLTKFRQSGWQIVGGTATPERTDGLGLGRAFTELIEECTIQDLQRWGFLSQCDMAWPVLETGTWDGRPRHVRFDGGHKELFDRYSKGGKRKSIVFAVSCAHAEDLCDTFSENYVPEAVTSTMSTGQIFDKIDRFIKGDVNPIISVDILGEGFDLPSVECVFLFRPTVSLTNYLQQVGRCLRPLPNKRATIIDAVGNSFFHGLPWETRQWSLVADPLNEKPDLSAFGSGLLSMQCFHCQAVIPQKLIYCPCCHGILIDNNSRDLLPSPRLYARHLEQAHSDEYGQLFLPCLQGSGEFLWQKM